MKKKLAIILITFLFFNSLLVYANSYNQNEIKLQINDAKNEMNSLYYEGFAINRYNDTLIIIEEYVESQISLEEKGFETNYDPIIRELNKLKKISENVRKVNDELVTLESTLHKEKINNPDIWESYGIAKESFESERYEEASLRVEITYQKLSEYQATETKIRAFYTASKRNIKGKIEDYWKIFIISVVIIIIIALLFYWKLRRFLISQKIKYLELDTESLKKLIAKAQQEYFIDGNISNSMYHTRIKRYGESLRSNYEIIPTLKKELILRKNKPKNKKKEVKK